MDPCCAGIKRYRFRSGYFVFVVEISGAMQPKTG